MRLSEWRMLAWRIRCTWLIITTTTCGRLFGRRGRILRRLRISRVFSLIISIIAILLRYRETLRKICLRRGFIRLRLTLKRREGGSIFPLLMAYPPVESILLVFLRRIGICSRWLLCFKTLRRRWMTRKACFVAVMSEGRWFVEAEWSVLLIYSCCITVFLKSPVLCSSRLILTCLRGSFISMRSNHHVRLCKFDLRQSNG